MTDDFGFTMLHEEEGTGLSPYKDEDPVLYRVVAAAAAGRRGLTAPGGISRPAGRTARRTRTLGEGRREVAGQCRPNTCAAYMEPLSPRRAAIPISR